MRGIKHQHIVITEGVIALIFLGLIYAWSIFRVPLSEVFPSWTPTQMSATFSISIIFFCIGGFLAGKISLVVNHRMVFIISAASLCLGFILLFALIDDNKFLSSLIVLYVFYGIFVGLGVGIAYNALLGIVVRWFPGKVGLASGILLLGFGVGGLLLGKFIDILSKSIGINNTFLVLGIVLPAIIIFIALSIKKPKSSQYRDAIEDNSKGIVNDVTLKTATSKPTFWIIFVWNIFMSTGGLLVINSAVLIALSFGMVAVMGLIVSVFNGIGRPLIGCIMDIVGRKTTMMINTLLLIVAGMILTIGSLSQNVIFIYIGLPLIGICYGGAPTLLSAVINKFYGELNYQVILAAATFSLAISAIVGPMISSRLQEISNGEYFSSFVMLIVVGLIALCFCLQISRYATKEGLE